MFPWSWVIWHSGGQYMLAHKCKLGGQRQQKHTRKTAKKQDHNKIYNINQHYTRWCLSKILLRNCIPKSTNFKNPRRDVTSSSGLFFTSKLWAVCPRRSNALWNFLDAENTSKQVRLREPSHLWQKVETSPQRRDASKRSCSATVELASKPFPKPAPQAWEEDWKTTTINNLYNFTCIQHL